MKKTRFLIILALLALALSSVFGLSACVVTVCTEHTDANGDGICDVCGVAFTCADHKDGDGNGRCDTCGAKIDATCTSHTDANGDGLCDVCGASVSNSSDGVALIQNGKANFQFVMAEGLSSSIRRSVDSIVSELEKLGISVSVVDDTATNAIECEVLVGQVTSRGEKYVYDMYTLGKKGYAITTVDSKVLLVAGDADKLDTVIARFKKDFLGLTDSTTAIGDVVITEGAIEIQDNYKIKSISVNGNSIREGYVIIADTSDADVSVAARTFQDTLYERAGIYLPIKAPNKATEAEEAKAIYVRLTDDAGTDGFRIFVDGDSLVVETEFVNKLGECLEGFTFAKIIQGGSEINFAKNFSYKKAVRKIYYEDFGAVGDGVTNDFDAIWETHDYANKYGHTVCATSGTTYYIGLTGGKSAVIMTDVVWTGATFIFDDSIISDSSEDSKERTTSIFVVKSDYSGYSLTKEQIAALVNANGGLDKTITKLNYAPGYATMLIPYNSNHYQYVRYGANASSGSQQHELIVIDGDGNIDELTPLLFDYETVTGVSAYRIDDKAITISGGTIITRANQADSRYNYYSRNINIGRSNVTIQNLTHRITGEADPKTGGDGAPYSGFISMSNCNNLLVQNCALSGHKTYTSKDNGTGMGSYDIGGGNANGMYFKNCTQINFFTDEDKTTPDTTLWGIMGTNYCKNITYDGCVLSRLDAHAGVYNATVKDSEVLYIHLIGGGTALIENSTIYNYSYVVQLRGDYGSLWDGDIIIRNVDVKAKARNSSNQTVTLINFTYANHDFGYELNMPKNIVIEGLTVSDTKKPTIYLFNDPTTGENSTVTDFTTDRVEVMSTDKVKNEQGALVDRNEAPDANGKYENLNPMILPESILIVNMSADLKEGFKTSSDAFLQSAAKDGRISIKFMTLSEYNAYLAEKEAG